MGSYVEKKFTRFVRLLLVLLILLSTAVHAEGDNENVCVEDIVSYAISVVSAENIYSNLSPEAKNVFDQALLLDEELLEYHRENVGTSFGLETYVVYGMTANELTEVENATWYFKPCFMLYNNRRN